MKRRILVMLAVSAMAFAVVPTASANGDHPGLTPDDVEAVVFPGNDVAIEKTVHTPEIPPNPAIFFLADTTGSMGGALNNVKANATDIMNQVKAAQSTAVFGAAQYRDTGDGALLYNLDAALTPTVATVATAIGTWSAGGGGDEPEAQLNALTQLAGLVYPVPSTPIIVWFGDASGHDPSVGATQATTIAALQAAGIAVIAINVPGADGLNATGQAQAIADATGGVFLNAPSSDDVANTILDGLSNLPIDVAMTSNCEWPISTTFSPDVVNVTSGDDAVFTETISVAAGAPGGTYECQDWALIGGPDGEPMTDVAGATIFETKTIHVPGIELSPPSDTNELGFDLDHTVTATVTAGDSGAVEGADVSIVIVSGPNTGDSVTGTTDVNGQIGLSWTPSVDPSSLGTDDIVATLYDPEGVPVATDAADKDWVDTTPPVAQCVETVNPNGKNIPKAPGKGGQGQNQDGFYQLVGYDVVWPVASLEVFVIDDGSGTLFGPFAIDTNIKYTEDDTAVPEQKKIGGPNSAVAAHIIGNGDAIVAVVDGSGNTGTATCLVPPPPK